ncbi:tensin-1-like [Gadus macrocephalus]|uniref:tensin-1-like n=1 Tax=Gadus macrocephalus TaxID=80720 RepID=UPI0028CB2FEA|nr:tensin-1-like [Gadus macrocephalus]
MSASVVRVHSLNSYINYGCGPMLTGAPCPPALSSSCSVHLLSHASGFRFLSHLLLHHLTPCHLLPPPPPTSSWRGAEYNARIRGLNASVTPQPSDRHRSYSFSGQRSRGMTPEGAPETARRRTTSEGQYQSGHDEPAGPRGPGTRSPDFSNALAFNAGGLAREGQLLGYHEAFDPEEFDTAAVSPDFHRGFADSRGQLSHFPLSSSSPAHSPDSITLALPTALKAGGGGPPARAASPSGGAQVKVVGVHSVPGSPNTLHRTVATNTPPSPALQRRAPGNSNREAPPPQPTSPLIGRGPRWGAGAGVPPSPLVGRRRASSSQDTPPAYARLPVLHIW